MEVALPTSNAYLFEKLRIDKLVVRDTQLLGHQNHSGRNEVSAIKRLYYLVPQVLDSGTLTSVFNLKDDDTTDGLADQF